jgi:hypothetical protein
MNVNKIAKIFVEQDEEIVFVVESILQAENDRIILVIPNVSSLTSSVVSLKILSRQVVKSDKLVILVCDNANAQHLCDKAKLTVRAKISDVDKEAWIEAKDLKNALLDNREKVKKELLGARTPGSEGTDIIAGVVAAKIVDDEPQEKPAEEEVQPFMHKPRLKAKVVDINGIKLISGGDIADTPEILDIERRRLNGDDEDYYTEGGEEDEGADARLVGTDISSIYPNRNNMKKGRKFKLVIPPFLKSFGNSGLGLKVALAAAVVFLIYAAYAYYALSDVSFTMYVEKNTKPFIKTITADADIKQSNPDGPVVVAEVISKTSSQKADATPTGKGATGDFATGEVTLFNLQATAVNLPAGTALVEQVTGKALRFLTQAAVTIPAAVGTDYGKISVNVKAEAFGPDSSMTGTVTYKVGASALTEVNGKSFVDFTKGTTKDTIIVSKEDLEALKASLADQLKLQLDNDLKSLLSTDDILLTGSQAYTEVSFISTAKEGEQVTSSDETPKFSGELKMTVTAMKVSKTELKSIMEQIIKAEAASGSDGQDSAQLKVALNDPVIDNVKVDKRKATFDLKSNASLVTDFDETKLKDLVKGKSVSEAKDILKRFNGVKDVRSKYNPSFIPFDWQKVSDDTARIKVSTTPYN